MDLLAARIPHYDAAAKLFTLADKGEINIFITSLSFANLNYLLTKQFNSVESRRILNNFKVLVNVLAVDKKIMELSLSSKFSDFEDAIQYYTALENNIDILITRNIKDFKLAKIAVLTAETYLKRTNQ